jgi:hypothetical protein
MGLLRYEFLVTPDEDVDEIAAHEGMAKGRRADGPSVPSRSVS